MSSSSGEGKSDRSDERSDDATPSSGNEGSNGGEEPVGYGRPPVGKRFRPGQSGNPRGRPRGARNLNAVIAAALGERVAVTENGARRRIPKLEAAVKQMVNRAASGEARATRLLLGLVQTSEAQTAPSDAKRGSQADAIVMAELMRRLEKQAK
jgi:Family of unknown function (DUF5681)